MMCIGPMMSRPSARRAARRTIGPRGAAILTVDGDRPTAAYGAQSMSAPLLDVLVKRPGPAFGARLRRSRPTASCTRSTSRSRGASTTRSSRCWPALGPRVHVLDVELDTPDLVYTFDPLLVTDRGAIPLRPGKPNRAPEPAAIEAWTRAAGIPTRRPDRGARARSRAATRSGCGRTCSASGGRCARTRRAPGSWPRWSAATCGSSTSRTGAGRPS